MHDKESVIANCKRVDNHTCSALLYNRIISPFDKFPYRGVIRSKKTGMSINISKFVNHIT